MKQSCKFLYCFITPGLEYENLINTFLRIQFHLYFSVPKHKYGVVHIQGTWDTYKNGIECCIVILSFIHQNMGKNIYLSDSGSHLAQQMPDNKISLCYQAFRDYIFNKSISLGFTASKQEEVRNYNFMMCAT